MLIVPVDRVFLLIVYHSLVCWIMTSVRLVGGQSSVDRHEQFGSNYWSSTAAVTNSLDLLQGSSPACHNDYRANTNPCMQATWSTKLSSNQYLVIQICANTHFPHSNLISCKDNHWVYNTLCTSQPADPWLCTFIALITLIQAYLHHETRSFKQTIVWKSILRQTHENYSSRDSLKGKIT